MTKTQKKSKAWYRKYLIIALFLATFCTLIAQQTQAAQPTNSIYQAFELAVEQAFKDGERFQRIDSRRDETSKHSVQGAKNIPNGKGFVGYGVTWISDFEEGDLKQSYQLGFSRVFKSESVVSFEPGIRYINKGYTFDINQTIHITGYETHNYLDTFCRLNIQSLPGSIKPYTGLSAGVLMFYKYELETDPDIDQNTKLYDGAFDTIILSLLLGIDFSLSDKYFLNIEYNLGMMKFGKYGWMNTRNSKSNEFLTSAILFSIGIK